MNCPTCGAPNVILHKDIWECGWCGDSGPIPRRILEQRKAAREQQEAWWQEAAATARWAAQTITESAAELLPGQGRKIPCMESHPLPGFSGAY